MTDIVERLRHSADMAAEDGIPSTLLKEAADEIERLRSSLGDMVKIAAAGKAEIERLRASLERLARLDKEPYKNPRERVDYCCSIARAALHQHQTNKRHGSHEQEHQ